MTKWIGLAARILVGAIFLIFGANGLSYIFLGQAFFPTPPPPEAGAQYFAVLTGSYIFKTVKIIEVAGALMLLSGVFLPLGAVLLAPIVVNIFLYHLTIDPSGMAMALVLVAGEVIIAWAYWDYFKSLFHVRKGF